MFRSPFADGVVLIFVLLLFFGPKQLPKLSRALGQSAKELKSGFAEGHKDDEADGSANADSDKTTV